MNINDLHQLPDSHPIAQRERISLAHIDVRGDLGRDSARIVKRQIEGAKISVAAASAFSIGQNVRTARRMGADFLTGSVVAIDGGHVTLDNGRTFNATVLVAA